MITEAPPPITIQMFRPSGRSYETEEGYDRLIRHHYGEAGQEFIEGLRTGGLNSSDVASFGSRIDPYFRRVFAKRFPHPADTTGQSSYREAQRIAREVVRQTVSRVYPNYPDDLFANEVALESPSPTDFFFYLAKGGDGEIAEYERRRHFLLLLGAAEIDSVSGNGELATQLMDINRLLDDKLFIPESRRQVPVIAQHDAETFSVRSIGLEKPKDIPSGVVLREHVMTLREIEGVGLVQTRIRQKDLASSVVKMLAYAAAGNGVLDSSVVNDYMGFTLITFEDFRNNSLALDGSPGLLVERVEALLRSSRSIKEIIEDDKTGDSRGQGGVRLQRRQVYLSDMPDYPLEIMVYKGEDYLTQSDEIGRIDPKTGFYDGRAHKLFSLRRLAGVLPYIRPTEIYGGDPRQDLINRMNEVADEIRNSGIELGDMAGRSTSRDLLRLLGRVGARGLAGLKTFASKRLRY